MIKNYKLVSQPIYKRCEELLRTCVGNLSFGAIASFARSGRYGLGIYPLEMVCFRKWCYLSGHEPGQPWIEVVGRCKFWNDHVFLKTTTSLHSGAKGQEALYAIPNLQEIVNRHSALKSCCVPVKWTAAFDGFILAPPLSLLMPDPTGQGYERWSRGQCLWSHALKCSEPWVSNHLIRQMCHKCSTIVSADRYDMPGSGNRVVRITTLQDLGCGKSPSDSEWALKMGFPQRAAPPR